MVPTTFQTSTVTNERQGVVDKSKGLHPRALGKSKGHGHTIRGRTPEHWTSSRQVNVMRRVVFRRLTLMKQPEHARLGRLAR